MILFFYGTDPFRVKEALKAADIETQTALDLPGTMFRLSPESNDPERLFPYLATAELFSKGKLAVVEDIGRFPDTFQKDLVAFVEARDLGNDERCFLLLTHIGTGAKGGSKKSDIVVPYFTKKPHRSAKYDALGPEEAAAWIKDRARDRGLIISDAASRMLAAQYTDSANFAQKIEKLALYLGVNRAAPEKVKPEHLGILDEGVVRQDAFKLIDALGQKNRGEACCILLSALRNGEDPVKLLGLLVYAVRSMLAVKEAGMRLMPNDLSRHTGLRDWQIRQYGRAAANFSLEDVRKLYERLMTTDYRMKTGNGDPKILLEKFLLSV